jgi:hypothetical protein
MQLNKYHFTTVLFGLLLSSFLISCEEEYTPEDVFIAPEIVVEGYIEQGDSALPPYVILTWSSPYLATFSPEQLNELFIHNAKVTVTDGSDTIQLTEICLNTIAAIDSALAQSLAQTIGLGDISLNEVNYCAYVDLAAFLGGSTLVPTAGKAYELQVVVEEDTARAITTIPPYVEFDSFFVVNHPDFPENDSLVELRGAITDPGGVENYYRLFTKRNAEPFYPLLGGSVTDDKIFNGRSFIFPIQRAEPFTTDPDAIDLNTFGYFWKGDTINIRSLCLDYEHFRFWQTLEYNTGSQGPFSSYVRIESNVEGGLGIWGGQSSKIYQLIVPE